jgi:hypothetical protein
MKIYEFFKKNRYLIAILLIGLIIFLPLIIQKTFFAGGDTVNFSSFVYSFEKQSFLQNHEIPLWNPYIFSGTPFFTNVIAAPNYPINFLSVFLNLPLYSWVNFSFFISFTFSGIFAYLFCKKLKLSNFSAFISALIFMFSQALVSRMGGDLSIVAGFLFLSANFFFLEHFFQKKDISSSIFLSISTALGFLGTHTQYFFYGLFALFLYFIFRFFVDYREIKLSKSFSKFILLCILTLIIFFGLISIQFFPTIEYSKYSWRIGYSFEDSTKCSLPPIQLITSILPNFFGQRLFNTSWGSPCGELAFYLGIFPLVLILFVLIYNRNKYSLFFLSLVIFSILFALGKYFPLFYIFYKFIPGFSIFNAPSRMLMVYSFAIAILAGFGIDNLVILKNNLSIKKFSIGLLIISLWFFINDSLILIFRVKILDLGKNLLQQLYYGAYSSTSFVQQHSLSSLFSLIDIAYVNILKGFFITGLLLACAGFLFYFIYKNANVKWIKFMILAILLVDICIFSLPYLNEKNIRNKYFPGTNSTEDIFKPNEEVLFLLTQNETELFRVYDFEGIIPQHLSIQNNIYQVTGYDTISLKSYGDYLASINLTNENSSKKLGLLNVKYILTREKINNPNLILIKTFNNSYVYKNTEFLPRFYLVDSSEKINAENVALIKYSPDEVILKVNGSGNLVFSDTYYLGWNAYIDNKKAEVFKFKEVVKSTFLSEGEHEVIFKFEPNSYFIGRTISEVTLFVIVLLFIYFIFKPSNSKLKIA